MAAASSRDDVAPTAAKKQKEKQPAKKRNNVRNAIINNINSTRRNLHMTMNLRGKTYFPYEEDDKLEGDKLKAQEQLDKKLLTDPESVDTSLRWKRLDCDAPSTIVLLYNGYNPFNTHYKQNFVSVPELNEEGYLGAGVEAVCPPPEEGATGWRDWAGSMKRSLTPDQFGSVKKSSNSPSNQRRTKLRKYSRPTRK